MPLLQHETSLIELDLVMIMNAQVHCTQLTLSVQCTNAQPTVNRIELCSFHQSVTNIAAVSLGLFLPTSTNIAVVSLG